MGSVKMEEGSALRMLSSLRPGPSQKLPAIGGKGGGSCPAPALLSQPGPKPKMSCHRWKWRRALPCACSPLPGRPQARNGLPSVEMEEGPALRLLSSLRPAPSQKWPIIGGNGGGPCPAPALLSQAGPKPEMAYHRWKWRRALPCACSPLSGRPQARNGLSSVEMEEGPAQRLLSSLRPAPSQRWPAIGGNGRGPCAAPALLYQAGPKPEMACHRWKWTRALCCACSPLSGRPKARNGLPSVEMDEGPVLRLLSSIRPAKSQKWPAIGGNGGGRCPAPALLSQAGPKQQMACHRWKWRRAGA